MKKVRKCVFYERFCGTTILSQAVYNMPNNGRTFAGAHIAANFVFIGTTLMQTATDRGSI